MTLTDMGMIFDENVDILLNLVIGFCINIHNDILSMLYGAIQQFVINS